MHSMSVSNGELAAAGIERRLGTRIAELERKVELLMKAVVELDESHA